ncbi:MAG: hypothetical protein KGL37_03390 [Acidobacteriota bacterium]|nr:hypothetical protein [Acidobacteriota bacterium]
MKLDIKAMAVSWAILWGGSVLLAALANLIWNGYAQHFLDALSSIYPGYHATRSFGSVVVVTLYAILDGLIGGVIFGWLYNRLLKPGA